MWMSVTLRIVILLGVLLDVESVWRNCAEGVGI